MLDRIEAMKFAGDIVIAYPGRNVTDEHATGWAREFVEMSGYEARRVVEIVTGRSVDPPSRAQIRQALNEVRQKTMSPGAVDSSFCVYIDGVECRNCGEVHGHQMDPADVLHGIHHLASHLEGKEGELDRAVDAEHCSCGFVSPDDVDIAKAIGLIAKSLTRTMR